MKARRQEWLACSYWFPSRVGNVRTKEHAEQKRRIRPRLREGVQSHSKSFALHTEDAQRGVSREESDSCQSGRGMETGADTVGNRGLTENSTRNSTKNN